MITEYDTLATVYADSILPTAEEAHARIVEDYLAEKVGFINVLDGQRTLISARLKSIEYRYRLNLAIARLRNLRGDVAPIAPAE
jgi:outer membrane protein TolC